MKGRSLKWIDFVPAASGLIGKIALISSFAVIWAQELEITQSNFVFENVRIDLLIGSVMTLLFAALYPHASPPGTLAPFVVLIPTMVNFGAHPLILSGMVGILGIISIKTKLIERLIHLSGAVGKASLTLALGISGIVVSVQKLAAFFGEKNVALILLIGVLALLYLLLSKCKKGWLMIPMSALVSFAVPAVFGLYVQVQAEIALPVLNPSVWWHEYWGIGFGLEVMTILKTIPFALFVIPLWAMDTVSVEAVTQAGYEQGQPREPLDLQASFLSVSLRNALGGLFGGAQTASLWRSFLIPLYMVRRPIRPAAILLGVMGVVAALTAVPVEIFLFPPLIWSVLLFGVFVPFTIAGVRRLRSIESMLNKVSAVLFCIIGTVWSPILTWVGTLLYEKLFSKKQSY